MRDIQVGDKVMVERGLISKNPFLYSCRRHTFTVKRWDNRNQTYVVERDDDNRIEYFFAEELAFVPSFLLVEIVKR